tara:strand:- start:95 stop:499 length:405 start_codon:yes stop_codon:yes gene_type:complete
MSILEYLENAKENIDDALSVNPINTNAVNLDKIIDDLSKALNHRDVGILKERINSHIRNLKLTRKYFLTPSGREDLIADLTHVKVSLIELKELLGHTGDIGVKKKRKRKRKTNRRRKSRKTKKKRKSKKHTKRR